MISPEGSSSGEGCPPREPAKSARRTIVAAEAAAVAVAARREREDHVATEEVRLS